MIAIFIYSSSIAGMRSVFVHINQAAIQHNYSLLAARVHSATIIAVVKANAYGHSLSAIVPSLYQSGCRHFAVTDAAEGVHLRLVLSQYCNSNNNSNKDYTVVVLLLSGIADEQDAALCQSQQLIPVLAQQWQVAALQKVAYRGYIWLKIDTGMQRIGAVQPLAFFALCQRSGLQVQGLLSHLACADTPQHPLNSQQITCFNNWRKCFAPISSHYLQASLLNSAGLAAFPSYAMDAVRPGIALYGVEPCASIALGLLPVMYFGASIVQCRNILAGESIGYGASFIASRAMRIGVIAAGYADGVPRLLSNNGQVMWQNIRLPIIGRVCMDHCMIDLTNTQAVAGDCIWFWNQCLTANEVASKTQTIAYELFTSIGQRVQRKIVTTPFVR